MASHYELSKMAADQLERELEKAKKRIRKAKEDVSLIKDFLKLKTLESAAESRKAEKLESQNPETEKANIKKTKTKIQDDRILTIESANYVD